MSENKVKIAYIGEDLSYWTSLKKRFEESYGNAVVELVQINDITEKNVLFQSVTKTITTSPKILFLDFSTNTDSKLILAKLLTRLNSTKDITIIGLHEGQNSEESIKNSILNGLTISHIKSAEFHAVLFDAMSLAQPDIAKHEKFAEAKTEERIYLKQLGRIGYYNQKYMHIEINAEFEEGDRVTLDTYLHPKLIPSKKFKVIAKRNYNLYYDYKYAYHLEYLYIDPPELSPREKEDLQYEVSKKLSKNPKKDELYPDAFNKAKKVLLAPKEEERQKTIITVKENFKEHILENSSNNNRKNTKVLIIDPQVTSLCDTIDELPFSIRLQSFLVDPLNEIKKYLPQIIFYELQMTKKSEEDSDEEIEDSENLNPITEILKAIGEIKDYTPYLIITSISINNQQAQTQFKYSQLLTTPNKLSINDIQNMSLALEKKYQENKKKFLEKEFDKLKSSDPGKFKNLTLNDLKQRNCYISKNDKTKSYAIHNIPATTRVISEDKIELACSHLVHEKEVYALEHPASMYLTLTDISDKEKIQGLIHSISETGKNSLRQFIYSIFVKEKKEKEEQEKKDFFNKNKAEFEKKESEDSEEIVKETQNEEG